MTKKEFRLKLEQNKKESEQKSKRHFSRFNHQTTKTIYAGGIQVELLNCKLDTRLFRCLLNPFFEDGCETTLKLNEVIDFSTFSDVFLKIKVLAISQQEVLLEAI